MTTRNRHKLNRIVTTTRKDPGTICVRCGAEKGSGVKCEPEGYGQKYQYHFYNQKSVLLTEEVNKYIEP